MIIKKPNNKINRPVTSDWIIQSLIYWSQRLQNRNLIPHSAIQLGWRKNTTDKPLIVSKLLLVVRAWIYEQNKIKNLLSINNQIKLKPKPNYGKILR